MAPRVRRILNEAIKFAIVLALFVYLQEQVIQVRRDLHGSANGIAEAQSRQCDELNETRKLIRTAMESSSVEFSQARRVFQESTELLKGERQELARLIDDRTGAIASTLKDRLETERGWIEGARTNAETNAALIQKLERVIDQDLLRMKRMMVFPTVQLRGSGTVGSGVLLYSEPQGSEDPQQAVTLVLTAHHVVMEVMGEKAAQGRVEEIRLLGENEIFEPDVLSGELVIFDRDRDLALLCLRTRRRFPYAVELAPRDAVRQVDVFTRAYAVGCPLGNRPLPTAGEVSSKSKVVGDQVFWMLNAPTFFGNSGGGIYLASSCQMIGLSSMIYTYGKENPVVVPHMGLFVPLESILDWLEGEGFSFIARKAPVPPDVMARLGIPDSRPAPRGPAALEEAQEALFPLKPGSTASLNTRSQ